MKLPFFQIHVLSTNQFEDMRYAWHRLVRLITNNQEQIMATQAEVIAAVESVKNDAVALREKLLQVADTVQEIYDMKDAPGETDLQAVLDKVAEIRDVIAGASTDADKIAVDDTPASDPVA